MIELIIYGALGQTTRGIAGVLKAIKRGRDLNPTRFVITLFLGAIIGGSVGIITEDTMTAFVAGYLGVDLLESLATILSK